MTIVHRDSKLTFEGAEGNRLVASFFDAAAGDARPPILLLHGGGQTRHAWDSTGGLLARNGFDAYAVDMRGHGESEWVASQAYGFADFALDAAAIADQIADGRGPRPIAIGASLGGIASLIALGERMDVFAGIILVDVTPRMDPSGLSGIETFMRAKAREGFATIDEAAAAIADYLPHRPRPKSLDGLKKNLRLRVDQRFYWHWDPCFFDGPHPVNKDREANTRRMRAAAQALLVPTLLVRGRSSELVGEAEAADFRALCPKAEYADIAGARHMVVGDENDAFSQAILDFLGRRFT